MSKVVATTVLPEDSGEILTFGDTGDAIAISGDSLNLNILQDAGGNNIFTSDGAGDLTVNSGLGGAFKHLTTNTFTGTTTSNFTTKIDSTYDVYCFRWNGLNAATDTAHFTFQGSIDGGSNYNVTMTTSCFRAYHAVSGDASGLGNASGEDQAQGTSYQPLIRYMGNESDAAGVGELYLFKPSSTTFVKDFYSTAQSTRDTGSTGSEYCGASGYFNTTSAINAISFKMNSGNMDGEIKMYGISKS